jgi:hypothetical protein
MGTYTGSPSRLEYTVVEDRKSVKKWKIGLRKSPKLTKTAKNRPKTQKHPPRPIRTLTSSVTFGESVAHPRRRDLLRFGPSRKRFPARSSWGVDVMLQSISSPRAEGASPPLPRCTTLKKAVTLKYLAVCPRILAVTVNFLMLQTQY